MTLLEGLTAPTVRMRTWRGLSVPGILQRSLSEHEAMVDALARVATPTWPAP